MSGSATSWNTTRITELLGISYPIVQGPFGGGVSSIDLLAVVSNAGGLGSFGAHHLPPAAITELLQNIRQRTARPFAINLWVADQDDGGRTLDRDRFEATWQVFEPYFAELGLAKPEYPDVFGQSFDEQVNAVLQSRPPVFSFVYGIPDPAILSECRARGIKTAGTAITVDEAVALDEAGVDIIVASGFEAGGHRVAFMRPAEESLIGTLALVPQVVDQVKAPVVAAGGIADVRGIKAAFALGAEAVQIGTGFLACEESNAHPLHRAQLFAESARHTALTRAFSGRLARGIENRLMREFRDAAMPIAPYPAQSWFTGQLKAGAVAAARPELMALWAGQAAGLLQHRSAQAYFDSLLAGLE